MDRDEFDQLVREHLTYILRLAGRLCGNPGSAEEVSQEAMLRASKAWRSFRATASFRTWLHRLTINAWRDHLRRRPPPEQLDSEALVARTEGPPVQAEARELGDIVAARVSSLPPRQREVMVLVAYENHSIAEAAAVLEVSEQNVRTTLHLAREKLRAQLAPYLEANSEIQRQRPI